MPCAACFDAKTTLTGESDGGEKESYSHFALWRRSGLGRPPSYKDFYFVVGVDAATEWLPVDSLHRVHTRHADEGVVKLTMSDALVMVNLAPPEAHRLLKVLKSLKRDNPGEALASEALAHPCPKCDPGKEPGEELDKENKEANTMSSDSKAGDKRKHHDRAPTGSTPAAKQRRTGKEKSSGFDESDGACKAEQPDSGGPEPMQTEGGGLFSSSEHQSPKKRRASTEPKEERRKIFEEHEQLERERRELEEQRAYMKKERERLAEERRKKEEAAKKFDEATAEERRRAQEYEAWAKAKRQQAQDYEQALERLRRAQSEYEAAQKHAQGSTPNGYAQRTNRSGSTPQRGGSWSKEEKERQDKERARKVQEEATRRQHEEAKRRAEEQRRRQREEEARRRRSEEQRRQREEERRRQQHQHTQGSSAQSMQIREKRLLENAKGRAQSVEKRLEQVNQCWEQLKKSPAASLGMHSFPWPDGSQSIALGERIAFITAFDSQNTIKRKVHSALKRWHPDKFSQCFGDLVAPSEKNAVFDKVNETAQLANQLRDLYLN